MKEQQARPCPICEDDEIAWGNVTRLWTRAAWPGHVREAHPGLDPYTLWQIGPRGIGRRVNAKP